MKHNLLNNLKYIYLYIFNYLKNMVIKYKTIYQFVNMIADNLLPVTRIYAGAHPYRCLGTFCT